MGEMGGKGRERASAIKATPENGLAGASADGPIETALAFAQALVLGDAAAAAAYFSPLARLLTPDGTELGGRSSITELLEQLVTPDHKLEIRTGRVLRADSIALCQQYWRRCSRRAEVELHETTSTARLVMQRHEECWQIMIAAPWG
jgi:ketosteroid isomerase-like protein